MSVNTLNATVYSQYEYRINLHDNFKLKVTYTRPRESMIDRGH
jgi:hypothetical protein